MHRLTDIEIAIVRGLAGGLQSKELAVMIGKSRATVEFHIRVLCGRLEARSRAQVVARAYALGYLAKKEATA